jgi:hypothetical protein
MSQPSVSMSPAEREIVEYGRISGWAIAAVLLGGLSATAIMGPILWLIPVMAIVISLIAMRRIQSSERQLSGWHLALLGLMLSVFFGMAGPARTLSRQYLLEARASHFAVKFMELLQKNQPLEAYQFALPVGVRAVIAPGQTELQDKSAGAQKSYAEFLKLAAVKMLLEAGAEAKIEPVSATYLAGDESRDDLTVKFRIRSPATGGKSTEVVMTVQRSLAYSSHTEQWQVIWQTLQLQ